MDRVNFCLKLKKKNYHGVCYTYCLESCFECWVFLNIKRCIFEQKNANTNECVLVRNTEFNFFETENLL